MATLANLSLTLIGSVMRHNASPNASLCFVCSITSAKKQSVLEQAHTSMQGIRDIIATRIASEVDRDTYYQYHRAFTAGMQEYVEARTFLSYLEDGSVASPQKIDVEIAMACGTDCERYRFTVDHSDYVQGIADLTGEMMRRGVASGGVDGVRIHDDLCDIEQAMNTVIANYSVARDMPGKMNVLHQSVSKVQRRCFDNAVRAAEVMPSAPQPSSCEGGGDDGDVKSPLSKKQKMAIDSVVE